MAGSESTIGALLDETGGSIKTGPFGTKLKASEYTATVAMPILRAVLMTRQAISPRLAISIFLNMIYLSPALKVEYCRACATDW